jgi:hypothetical protein
MSLLAKLNTVLKRADSKQFYAASFNMDSLDRSTLGKSAAPDVMYDVETLSDGKAATLSAALEKSPVRCSAMRCGADLAL